MMMMMVGKKLQFHSLQKSEKKSHSISLFEFSRQKCKLEPSNAIFTIFSAKFEIIENETFFVIFNHCVLLIYYLEVRLEMKQHE